MSRLSGTIHLGIGNDGQWKKLCEFLGRPEMANEPRFATNADRFRERDALHALLEKHLLLVDGEWLAANCWPPAFRRALSGPFRRC
ncbi:CoA-transferase family III [Noviherbaspirillum suwonense]|uniref:CoA-transferase family III n=1 Tax=Noviherbaspirillum suwonense TaxID=1224511 RepID=A0ABY1QSL5_9BURK|nr:CoA transferase [Noviherbaspirillum suwonense]SMP76526.1 CoA-transferase family III [Noviherbaspirillum suwonense]